MKLLIVLTCCRGELLPVPGAAGVRELVVPVVWHVGVLCGLLVAQADGVVDELAPRPAPLRDVVLGEEVLADVVEDAVADVARRWAGGHLAVPDVVRGRDTGELRPCLPPRGVSRVVAAPVERAARERIGAHRPG